MAGNVYGAAIGRVSDSGNGIVEPANSGGRGATGKKMGIAAPMRLVLSVSKRIGRDDFRLIGVTDDEAAGPSGDVPHG